MDKKYKNINLDELENIVEKSLSLTEVIIFFNYDAKNPNVRKNFERLLKKNNISNSHFETVQRLSESKERYKKELLEELVKNSINYKDILSKLDLLPITSNYNTLKRNLELFNIDYEHLKQKEISKKKYKKEFLENIIKNSNTKYEVLEKLNLFSSASFYYTILKYCKKFNINVSHLIEKNNKQKNLSEILVKNSTYSRTHLKKRLYENGLKKKECEKCGQDEWWRGEKISLILDHINGIPNDNRLENLRILCPNCNAALPTHCRGGKKKKDVNNKNNINFQKKKRPKKFEISKEELEKLMNKLSMVKIGGIFGVSDNAIRKRAIKYGILIKK